MTNKQMVRLNLDLLGFFLVIGGWAVIPDGPGPGNALAMLAFSFAAGLFTSNLAHAILDPEKTDAK